MVNLKNICLSAIGIASVLTVTPSRVEACKPSDLRGRVKSVISTEALIDSVTGKTGEAEQRYRIDVSQDGGIVEMTLYAQRSAEPRTTFTSYFESGKLVRGFEVANSKTVSTTTCSYDLQGRLLEARTESDHREGSVVETYEYGAGSIRRRARAFGGPSVTTQTLDATSRVIKEVVLDEVTSTVVQTIDFSYTDDREERCVVSSRDPRRHCVTTVRDSHGNEVEVRSEVQTRKTSFEYDSAGNWISRRLAVSGPRGTTVETIVRRKIEYW